uniref:Uncharacterized protein LOC111119884 n=1 Tax=Crassostrea virginica TaxID=6565 RepID=A0A8B8CK78_CRAVI|nr:uncharacterized protein LOC111119884 [Crassostrea virginica]
MDIKITLFFFTAGILSFGHGTLLGYTELEKINTLATRHLMGAVADGLNNLSWRTKTTNIICNDEVNRIRKYVCSKCAATPVVPPMSVIQQNLNRPLPIILNLFFDVLDALTPSWMVEQVGNRKYMMEEDFLRVADNLKAATSPDLGTPLEESVRISREIDEKVGNVSLNFRSGGFAGRRKRQSTITMVRSCSDCANLDGMTTEDYINIVCGTTTMRSIQSVMDFVDKYRLIFNTTFGSGDPVIEEVEFDEKTVMYQFSPFLFEAMIKTYRYRIEDSVLSQTMTPISLKFHNLNETAIFIADEILKKHVYDPVPGFGFA